ncbi:hypothetical protein CB1_002578011 [Camelus ferus]|nr:hypothetical protein CB1_002578011 [Camelus ferus]
MSSPAQDRIEDHGACGDAGNPLLRASGGSGEAATPSSSVRGPLLLLAFWRRCLCYGRSLRGEFVHDDVWAIVNNPDVRPGAPLHWGIFSNDFWGKGHGREHQPQVLPAAARPPLQVRLCREKL